MLNARHGEFRFASLELDGSQPKNGCVAASSQGRLLFRKTCLALRGSNYRNDRLGRRNSASHRGHGNTTRKNGPHHLLAKAF
jgi:hypothetical protein